VRAERRITNARISNAMGTIRLETVIKAPIERCFDLARSVDAHLASTASTGERVVAGKAHGLLELGESVTWEGRYLAIRLRQGAVITRLDRPHMFVDEGTSGPLHHHHLHQFVSEGGGTLMVDTFDYELPNGVLGRLADRIVVGRRLRRLFTERTAYLKAEAERET
jgi:ligand-binding SRPBCC domain-containing protein